METYKINRRRFKEINPQGDRFLLEVFLRQIAFLSQGRMKICYGFKSKSIHLEVVGLIVGTDNIENNFAPANEKKISSYVNVQNTEDNAPLKGWG